MSEGDCGDGDESSDAFFPKSMVLAHQRVHRSLRKLHGHPVHDGDTSS